MKLLIKYPSRSRPTRFMQTFELYKTMLSGKHEVSFLCSFDADDETMNTSDIHNWVDQQGNLVKAFWGNSKTKIQAVNADLKHAGDYDVLLLASDDMIPQVYGYDDIIMEDMQTYYPDGDGVLHYNDGRTGEKLNTLCILGKKYFDRFGYIYHPDYISLYADNEYMKISIMLNKVKYFENTIIRHAWAEIGWDELYKRNEDRMILTKDQSTYEYRRANNFGI